MTLSVITNADRALTTSNFSLIAYYSNDPQAQVGVNSVTGITMQPKQLNSSQISVNLSDSAVSATSVTANITFIPLDAVGPNGYITVTIPP